MQTETSASLVNAITDNAVFHSSSHINKLLPQVVHILRMYGEHVAQGWNKIWKTGRAKNFRSCHPTIPVCPHLLGDMRLCPLALGHACCDHNESESYRPTIIRRHCVDQQTDSLVVTEFQSDHREWSHWKREVKDQFSPPCIEIWRGIRPPGPTACSTPDVAPFCTQLDYGRDVLRPQIWKIIWVTIISEIITLLDCRQWMMHSMSE